MQTQLGVSSESSPGIFIVEDEAVVAKHLAVILQELGYRVVGHAAGGTAAVLRAPKLEPDLILMNIGLAGGVDGLAAAAELAKHTSIPIVFVSAFTDPDTQRRARDSNAFGFIIKPFQRTQIRGVLEVALRRSRIEADYRAGQRLFSVTLQSIADGVVTTNEREEVTFLNRAAERITGWPLAEATGRKLAEVMPLQGAIAGQPVVSLKRALAERHPDGSPQAALLVGKRETIAIEDSAAPTTDDKAEVLGGVLVFREVSAGEAPAAPELSLVGVERLAQYARAMAHDLNDVLSLVLINAQLLSSSLAVEDGRRRELIEIEARCNDGALLTRQMLNLFGDRQSHEAEVIDLNEALTSIEHILRSLAGEAELSLVQGERIGTVMLDRAHLERILVDLVTSACRVAPRGSTVQIQTSSVKLLSEQLIGGLRVQGGHCVMLTVSDDCQGLGAHEALEAFESLQPSSHRIAAGGTGGAGPADFLAGAGGAIGLFADPDRGKVLRLYLPTRR